MGEGERGGLGVIDICQDSAREQLEFVAARFPVSMEAQYLRLGKWLTKDPLAKCDLDFIAHELKNIHAYRPGDCYMNAWKIATNRDVFTFCEGYAAGLWPVPHAWVTYKGRAIDVTWPTRWERGHVGPARSIATIMQRVEHNLKSCSYLGVEVPTAVIRDHALEQKTYSPLFDGQFHRRWPEFEKAIATGKFPCYNKSSKHTER